jgi:hypothetical protein
MTVFDLPKKRGPARSRKMHISDDDICRLVLLHFHSNIACRSNKVGLFGIWPQRSAITTQHILMIIDQ